MSKKIVIYYLVIAAVVAGKAALTIFERSQAVNHGFTIVAEHSEQRELQTAKRQLTAELAERRSLTTLAQAPELSGYTKISSPVVVTTTQTLASLQ